VKVQYLITDHSHALAAAVIEMVKPALREEELAELRGMLIEAAKGMLLSYEGKMSRVVRRLKPSDN